MPDIYTITIFIFGFFISILMVIVIIIGFRQYMKQMKKEDENGEESEKRD